MLVIVLYNERLQDTKTYNSLIRENPDVPLYIYDNSPSPQHSPDEFFGNIHYKHNSANPGLSVAYNQAAVYASFRGFKWILLLDQDTTFAPGILTEYEDVIHNHPGVDLIVAPMRLNDEKYMSPVPIFWHITKPVRRIPYGKVLFSKYFVINSGMAIKLSTFFEVGGYNENVRLDFSDFQFIERFRRHYKDFFVLKSACLQEFSNQIQSQQQKLERYKIFCDCAAKCETQNWIDKSGYICVVVKRAIALSVEMCTLKPWVIFFKYFK